MNKPKKKIVFVTSDIYFVRGFLKDQIIAASKEYRVYLLVNSPKPELLELFDNSVSCYSFNIQRKISIFRDLSSLIELSLFLIKIRPDILHSTTPKAGLISMVAAYLTRIPVRIHTFTGQVWQTKTGFYRFLLKSLDTLTALTATFIICDSHSQRRVLIHEGVLEERKSTVILRGSIRGVDPNRFKPRLDKYQNMRHVLNLVSDAPIILYMARFTRDKGALLMAMAFKKMLLHGVNAHLLMVGPDEEGLKSNIKSILSPHDSSYTLVEYTTTPEEYFSSCDIFCLPSYREGFPMVLLNAAASGVPVISSRIYGSVDAVQENVTGLLFEVGSLDDFTEKLISLSVDKKKRKLLGINARNFAINNFSEEEITKGILNLYSLQLNSIEHIS